MTDYRPRYKPHRLNLGSEKESTFAVIEEHSRTIVAKGPMNYDDALKIADRKNAELAASRISASKPKRKKARK